jgi:hypothetical protein
MSFNTKKESQEGRIQRQHVNNSDDNNDNNGAEIPSSDAIPNNEQHAIDTTSRMSKRSSSASDKPARPRRPRRSMSVEDYVYDSFLYHVNDEDYALAGTGGRATGRPIVRRRVFFALGLLLGLFLAVNFTSDNSPEFLRGLSALMSMPLADLDFRALLPASIGVDEFIGNITAKLGPVGSAESNMFEPGATMAREEGLKAKYPVVLIPGIISTVS